MTKSVAKYALFSLLILFTLHPALAAIDIANIPNTPFSAFPNPGVFISTLLDNVFILAGLVMFIIIFIGGFTVISGGGGDPKKTQQGSEAVTWAIVGFVVIFASYWILQIVKVITGIDILHPNI